jgi:predicted Zn-dependent protease
MLARVALVTAAIGVAAWLGVGVYEWRNQDRAEELIRPAARATPAQADRADRLLRRAQRLNPDQGLEINRGIAALEAGRAAKARRILLGVTRAEPQNIEAWAWLRNAADAAGDRALFGLATRRIAELRPPVE